jgi:hypothetical protein
MGLSNPKDEIFGIGQAKKGCVFLLGAILLRIDPSYLNL